MDIKKIIDLIAKTDDKFIVVDQDGRPNYVIMSFSAYEKALESKDNLAGLTEEELLGKINRDVATWKDAQDEARLQEFETLEQVLQEEKKQENEVEEKYYFEPVE